MSNYNIRKFRSELASYVNQSPIDIEVKSLVLKDLAAQAEKEADAIVAREAAELERATQLKKDAEKKAAEKESEVKA